MTIHDCIKFAREFPVCCLATVEGDQPRARNVLLWQVDTTGFYFILLSPKSVSAQLKANPKAELCFYNHHADMLMAKQLRITGIMELVKDPVLQAKAEHDRAFLAQLTGHPVEPLLEIFRLTSCDAHFWTMPDFLQESKVEHVKL
jgi:uncharacterized pyridoxamine 5'-phosphate oxidase family protein